MSGQLQEALANLEALADQQADIIAWHEEILEQLRAIFARTDLYDREIVRQARIALSDWFVATYPHLYPAQDRPQLKVIAGTGGSVMSRRSARYSGDRICLQCGILVLVEVVVQDPVTVGYRCGAGHMWLARMPHKAGA